MRMPPAVIVACAVIAAVTAFAQSTPTRDQVQGAITKALKGPADLDAYLATLPQIEGYYLTEGDLLRTKDEVAENFERLRAQPRRVTSHELTVNLTDTGDDIWPRDRRALTYSIDRASFASSEQANEALADVSKAASEWAHACGTRCGVTFTFKESQTPSPTDVTFVIRAFDSHGRYVAASFFPSWAPARRFLNIDPSFFTLQKPLTGRGVMRHELGHVLGYRHEHLQGVPGCYEEDGAWRRVVPYSPTSVMHYLCGGRGSPQLALQPSDRRGHRLLYGRQS